MPASTAGTRRPYHPAAAPRALSRRPLNLSHAAGLTRCGGRSPFIKDGALALDWEDEVMAGSCLAHAGELRHAGVKQALGL